MDDPQPATLVTTWSTSRAARGPAIVAAGARQRVVLATGVQLERTAALLAAGHEHVAALGGEHPHRRLVDPVEEHVLDAPGEQRDRGAPLAHVAGVCSGSRANASRSDTGGSSDSRAPSRPGSFAASVRTGRQPAQLLVDRPGQGGRPQPSLVGEQREDRLAEQPGRRARGGRCARSAGAPTRSACRTARPTGRRSRRPCSPGSASMCSVNGPSSSISPFSARFIR